MTATAVLGTFHEDAVRQFKAEFPEWVPIVDRLVSEGKIAIVEQERCVNDNSSNKN